MPDRLIVAEIPTEGLVDDGDVEADLAIEEQLKGAGFDFQKHGSVVVTNEKPGEDEPPTAYVVTKIEVATTPTVGVLEESTATHELFACSCPAYKYQLPSKSNLSEGVVGVAGIGDCKHSKEVKRRRRDEPDSDDAQQSLADQLGIDVDDGGDA